MEADRKPNPDALLAYISKAFPERQDPEVAGFREISAGWESDVYAFDLVSGAGASREREPLVLRVYPGTDADEKAALEFRALQRLHRVGYPVPQVFHLALDASPFAKPCMVMERVRGQGMWRSTFSGPEGQQRDNFELFMTLFVRLHSLDWRALVDDVDPFSWDGDPYAFFDGWLTRMDVFIEQFDQPGYRPLLHWLAVQRERMACARPAPIHWDYHPDNILVGEAGAVVIDWTQFEISDPRFDLAWTMTLVGSQEGDDVRRRIQCAYERMTGAPVTAVELFEVFACAKRLASVTLSLSVGAERLGMRAGAEAMMRRQLPALRRVYDRFKTLTSLHIPEVDALFETAA